MRSDLLINWLISFDRNHPVTAIFESLPSAPILFSPQVLIVLRPIDEHADT
jgi:hypothetical protein